MMLRVFAMARPSRPLGERDLVSTADSGAGTVSERASRLALSVANASMADIDRDDADRVIGMLRALAPTAIDRLANDPEFGTGALIVRERLKRLEARGGKHLHPSDWKDDDRAVIKAVASTLSRRYRSYLAGSASRKLP